MNRIIAKSLAQSLINLDFITRAAGCVQEITLPLKGGKSKKLPAATEVYTAPDTCKREETYKDLIPNSKEVGILYFEDLGSKMINRSKRRESWKGTLKLVCWVQTAEVCDNVHTIETIDDIVCSVKDAVNQEIAQQGSIFAGRITVVAEYPKRPSPFDKYDYDEKETQYLIHPFDYFSLRVEYTVHGLCNCGQGSDLSLQIPQSGYSSLTMYSLEETKTGLKDYDGKDIYVKTIVFDAAGRSNFGGMENWDVDSGIDADTVHRLVDNEYSIWFDFSLGGSEFSKVELPKTQLTVWQGNTVAVTRNIYLRVANSFISDGNTWTLYYTKV